MIYEPVSNNLYVACRGGGALLNDRRLRIRQQPAGHSVLVAASLGVCRADQQAVYFGLQQVLTEAGMGLRWSGSSALDLAYVAAGYLNGTWQQGIQPWGMAAGMLLVREAGGIVTTLQEGNDPLSSGDLLAGQPKIHATMLKHVTQCYQGEQVMQRGAPA